MNPDFKVNTDYYFDKRVLELTSEGYSTREAKRKVERENRRKWKKIGKQWRK